MSPHPASILAAVRDAMARGPEPLDAFIAPAADPHLSEYVPDCWQRRRWLTGFDGSAGDAAVTRDRALLWTDSRYWLQAERQAGPRGFDVIRAGAPGAPSLADWLASLGTGARVGIDPNTISLAGFESLRARLARAAVSLLPVERNPVDAAWHDRPATPAAPITAHPLALAGASAADKLAALRASLRASAAHAHAIGGLDAIAWLTNLRGGDVPFNPVFIAWMIVTHDAATLFTDRERMSRDVAASLEGVAEIAPYAAFPAALRALGAAGRPVWIDDEATSAWVANTLVAAGSAIAERGRSPVSIAKARKNDAEIAAMRAAHLRDGVAMARFLRWLESDRPRAPYDEADLADRLEDFRREGEGYLGPSFASIVGYAANGAIVHYRPERPHAAQVGDRALLLIDSGAQYTDGTTDVTRTLHLGAPTSEDRAWFTLVLRAHIAVARQRFPMGTRGAQIDAIARSPIWQAGLDYGHGTGHGVGARLSVHESPPNISTRPAAAAELEPGMIFSNEPGLYTEGKGGVRIENLMLVAPDGEGADGRPWMRLEPLTLAPFQRSLIDAAGLSGDERAWVNDYHRNVRISLSPLLGDPDRAWLEGATAPL